MSVGAPRQCAWRTPAAAALVLAILFAVAGCESEKKRYLAVSAPIIAQMDQVAAEMEAIAALAQDVPRVQEAEGRLKVLDERIRKITTDFTSIFAPMELEYYHANLVKALASEATGLSAIRGYIQRSVNAGQLAARVTELTKREAALAADLKDARPKQEGVERKKLEHQRAKDELEKLKAQQQTLKGEMDGQMKYLQDNHRFFKGHLRVYKEKMK